MRRALFALLGCLMVAGCASAPRTDDELADRAQEAVNRKLGAQATYSEMEAAIVLHIACGHAHAVTSGTTIDKDFVYRDGKLLMEDDDGFDAAAAQCDAAVGGASDS